MIRTKELLEFIGDNLPVTIDDIAHQFNVTTSLVVSKLELMAVDNPYPKIDEHRTLCLSALPSLFVLEML